MMQRLIKILSFLAFLMPCIAFADSSFKQLDIVVIIPAEFLINPHSKQPLGISAQTAENEIRTAINLAEEYYKPLNIKFNIVKVINYNESNDPYRIAYQNLDANKMLEIAIENSGNYDIDYDLGIVVGRRTFNNNVYGLAYESVSCTNHKFSQIFVTSSGISEQRKYSFAHTIAHEIGHILGMKHDYSTENGQSSIMAENFHAKPYGFSSDSISKALTRISGLGGECLSELITTDTDSDGFSDSEEEEFGSQITDRGSLPILASKKWYSSWNSFLNLVNIIELLNRSNENNTIEISLRDIFGKLIQTKKYTLKPYTQFDVILNEWEEFRELSYGIIELNGSAVFDGRVSLYSIDKLGSHNFSTSIPFMNSIVGISNLSFNSFYPHAANKFDYVQNWLTLINLDSVVRSFRISSFDTFGNLIKTNIYSILPGARLDIDGGHEIIDTTRTGMHQIVPTNTDKPYIAYLSRYGFSGNKNSPTVKFASVQLANSASGVLRGNSIVTKTKGYSYLEVLNAKSSYSKFNLKIYSPDGVLLSSANHQIPGFSQIHLGVSEELIKRGYEFGTYTIKAEEPESISAELYNYKLGNKFGEVVTANLASPEVLPLRVLSGSYNLFLQANNYVFINNYESASVTVDLLNSGNVIQSIEIPANASKMLSLRNLPYFSKKDSSYGTLEITSSQAKLVSASMLREGTNNSFAALMLESNFR